MKKKPRENRVEMISRSLVIFAFLIGLFHIKSNPNSHSIFCHIF